MNNHTLMGVKQVVLDLAPAYQWLLCTFIEKLTSRGHTPDSIMNTMVFKETMSYMFGAVIDDLVTYYKNQRNKVPNTVQSHNLVMNEIADSIVDYFPNQQEAMFIIGRLEDILMQILVTSIPEQLDVKIQNYYLLSENTLLIELNN